jgi:hypothetical protein
MHILLPFRKTVNQITNLANIHFLVPTNSYALYELQNNL